MDASRGQISVTPLNYAPPLPWHRRRTARRVVLVAAIVLGCLFGYHRGPPIVARFYVLYQQRRCLAYVPPRGVEITKDQAFVPEAWRKFFSAASHRPLRSDGTVFLGEMRTPRGERRLVAIDYIWWRGVSRAGVSLDASVIIPGTLLRAPSSGKGGFGAKILPDQSRIFFGQLDPTDSSHITITATDGSETWRVDGWLRDDDTLILERAAAEPSR